MLNEKAYALSVRDDTSFRVEGDSADTGFSIAKVGITSELVYTLYGPTMNIEGAEDYIFGTYTFSEGNVTVDVIVHPEYPARLIFEGVVIYNVGGHALVLDSTSVAITGDATITLAESGGK